MQPASRRTDLLFVTWAGALLAAAAAGWTLFAAEPKKKDKDAEFLSKEENEVVRELNEARQYPAKFAGYLKERKPHYRQDNSLAMPGFSVYSTQEGVKAVDEAIVFLEKTKPIPTLQAARGISLAAADHAEDIGPKGAVEHAGTDKSQPADRMARYGTWKKNCAENISAGWSDPRQIVLQLIIDDGVADRGHRKNIFEADYRVVGVAIRPHKQYKIVCVMDFAGAYTENESAQRKRTDRKTDPRPTPRAVKPGS